jgi:hypothetical protein
MAWFRRSSMTLPPERSGANGGHLSCPLGPGAQEVCLDDPRRLEQWPAICHTCALVAHRGSSKVGADAT